MGGALALSLSSGPMHWRWGGSWRHLIMKRLAAWRSQSLLSVPSCFTSGSGMRGITSRLSGWTIVAPSQEQSPPVVTDSAGALW